MEFGAAGVTIDELSSFNCALTLSDGNDFALVAAPESGFATSAFDRENELAVIKEEVAFQVSSHDLTSEVVNPSRPAFQVNASSSSSSVQITAGKQFSSEVDGDGKLKTAHLTFKLSSPLNKDEELTDLATLDGLANSTSLAVSWRRVISDGLRTTGEIEETCSFEELTRLVREKCKFQQSLDGTLSDEEIKSCENDVVVFGSVKFSDEDLRTAGCSLIKEGEPMTTNFYGLNLKVGHEEFDVLDQASFNSTSTSESPVSAGIYGGFVPRGGNHSFLFGFEYQRVYKASSSRTLCSPPASDSEQQECKTGSFSEPTKTESQLLYVEYRRRLQGLRPLSLPVAFNFRTTYDFESDALGVDVPIYFLQDSDQKLTGGLRMGWRSDTHDFMFGVFVGSSFSIFSPE